MLVTYPLQRRENLRRRPGICRVPPAFLSLLGAAALAAAVGAVPAVAQASSAARPVPVAPQVGPAPGWTDWVDLALGSPVVLSVETSDIDRLSKRDAPDVPAGEVRAIVRAGLTAAIRAPGVLPAEAAWRWQGPADARGRAPIPKGARYLLFAAPLSGGGDPAVQPLKLTGTAGMQPWSAEGEAIVREVLTQALGGKARAMLVTGVRDGFRTEGDVPGTSESQFFLEASDGLPLTLVVERAPGAEPRVLATGGELVDRARPVSPRTLLWRGLACGMPEALPASLSGNVGLVADYALARERIGPCGRRLAADGSGNWPTAAGVAGAAR
jgi:hypothetical protein